MKVGNIYLLMLTFVLSALGGASAYSQEIGAEKLSIKTNAAGLGLAIANAGVEIDICKHLSFNLPVYYSAWDYSRETVKFRTLATQPELRAYISKKNEGFYAGAHFGFGYYNFATDGEFRLQDHDGESPAIGCGLSLGYKLPISESHRWHLEFSVGGGIYELHYDLFRNYHNGLLVRTEKSRYIGFDQAAVSISYSFDIKRNRAEKEGVR